ncbi:MAG TPA: hypothetical protein VH743_21835 [Beijerinckiaceae bacterium]|jgi:hypothetical protein
MRETCRAGIRQRRRSPTGRDPRKGPTGDQNAVGVGNPSHGGGGGNQKTGGVGNQNTGSGRKTAKQGGKR